ncbi:hypothetical protein EC9_28550 [Rosistilla ulvae]|uniref:Uncharacterized protein n=1 Tax=Rosistilla ulvae TaxID=1930277 RepID=A0A517M1B0_9BACT|nr:hypothetical protein [Rosistilla ulvae]QDS88664.1 hypothetical protein EC9_28550 [Rosistilla ulvae]
MMKQPKTKSPPNQAAAKRNRRILGVVLVVCIVSYSVFVAQKFTQLTSDTDPALSPAATSTVTYSPSKKKSDRERDALLASANEIDRELIEKLERKKAQHQEASTPGAARSAWHKKTEQMEEELKQFSDIPEGSVQDVLKKKIETYNLDKPSL